MLKAVDLKGLHAEIALLRVKLVGVVSAPGVPPELFLQAIRTLIRMVDIQNRITFNR